VKPISTGSNILQWTLRDRATETVVGLCEGIRGILGSPGRKHRCATSRESRLRGNRLIRFNWRSHVLCVHDKLSTSPL